MTREPKYFSAWTQSDGAPENGRQEHTSKTAAIAAAKRGREALYANSGGESYAYPIDRDVYGDVEPTRSNPLYLWIEDVEGGYRAV